MNAITITITVSLPEGATATVSGPPPAAAVAPSAQLASLESGSDWVCPTHGGSRVVPAGVSKRTGKPYPAFKVCVRQDCDQKEAA